MMGSIEAWGLGIIQGMTEFFPVSSSGHLVLAQQWFGITHSTLTFDILLHGGTLIAILIFFWPKLIKLTFREIWLMGVATVPAVIAGLGLKDQIEEAFMSLSGISLGFIISGGLLLFIKRWKSGTKTINDLSVYQVLIIGIMQALAIIPSISRSGATMVAGLLMGLSREAAFDFAFILAVPVIMGAIVMELPELSSLPLSEMAIYAQGFVGALGAGLGSIYILKKIIKADKLFWFGWYCVGLGLATWWFTM